MTQTASYSASDEGKTEKPDLASLSESLIAKARAAGADYADVNAYHMTALHTSFRHGKQDDFEREEDIALGLRVFCGQSSACLSTSDLRPDGLERIAQQAVAMARHIPADEFACTPQEHLDFSGSALKLSDPAGEPDVVALNDLAQRLEQAGLAHEGITNSEGADASWTGGHVYITTSTGFQGSYRKDSASASVSLIGGEGTMMERDYAYDHTTCFADLDKAEDIAALAATRTLNRLNPRKGKTGSYPVIYDRRVSNSLVRHLLAAINGNRIAKGTSFLNDAMGKQILPQGLTLHDNPHLDFMPKSKPFDAEGQDNPPMELITDGVLQNWILDLRTAGKLGVLSNGRAARGLASQPSPASTNTWLEGGKITLADMTADIKDGFYVTELLGSSVSLTTGDYSRGASGFWIENGQIAYPVSEVTIAGNLKDMLAGLIAADDLRRRYGCDSPSLMVPRLSIGSAA